MFSLLINNTVKSKYGHVQQILWINLFNKYIGYVYKIHTNKHVDVCLFNVLILEIDK